MSGISEKSEMAVAYGPSPICPVPSRFVDHLKSHRDTLTSKEVEVLTRPGNAFSILYGHLFEQGPWTSVIVARPLALRAAYFEILAAGLSPSSSVLLSAADVGHDEDPAILSAPPIDGDGRNGTEELLFRVDRCREQGYPSFVRYLLNLRSGTPREEFRQKLRKTASDPALVDQLLAISEVGALMDRSIVEGYQGMNPSVPLSLANGLRQSTAQETLRSVAPDLSLADVLSKADGYERLERHFSGEFPETAAAFSNTKSLFASISSRAARRDIVRKAFQLPSLEGKKTSISLEGMFEGVFADYANSNVPLSDFLEVREFVAWFALRRPVMAQKIAGRFPLGSRTLAACSWRVQGDTDANSAEAQVPVSTKTVSGGDGDARLRWIQTVEELRSSIAGQKGQLSSVDRGNAILTIIRDCASRLGIELEKYEESLKPSDASSFLERIGAVANGLRQLGKADENELAIPSAGTVRREDIATLESHLMEAEGLLQDLKASNVESDAIFARISNARLSERLNLLEQFKDATTALQENYRKSWSSVGAALSLVVLQENPSSVRSPAPEVTTPVAQEPSPETTDPIPSELEQARASIARKGLEAGLRHLEKSGVRSGYLSPEIVRAAIIPIYSTDFNAPYASDSTEATFSLALARIEELGDMEADGAMASLLFMSALQGSVGSERSAYRDVLHRLPTGLDEVVAAYDAFSVANDTVDKSFRVMDPFEVRRTEKATSCRNSVMRQINVIKSLNYAVANSEKFRDLLLKKGGILFEIETSVDSMRYSPDLISTVETLLVPKELGIYLDSMSSKAGSEPVSGRFRLDMKEQLTGILSTFREFVGTTSSEPVRRETASRLVSSLVTAHDRFLKEANRDDPYDALLYRSAAIVALNILNRIDRGGTMRPPSLERGTFL